MVELNIEYVSQATATWIRPTVSSFDASNQKSIVFVAKCTEFKHPTILVLVFGPNREPDPSQLFNIDLG